MPEDQNLTIKINSMTHTLKGKSGCFSPNDMNLLYSPVRNVLEYPKLLLKCFNILLICLVRNEFISLGSRGTIDNPPRLILQIGKLQYLINTGCSDKNVICCYAESKKAPG